MATLLLTAVGTALGGPIGAAVGAAIGYSVDAKLFAPKARHGPRLGDLAVQGSSYGTQIPKLFGRFRTAGSVIWATDLRERRSSTGGGKGRPKTVNYSYSASFAVALSGRPILAVGRIWADGKLLRGEAGDFKTETKFRLHLGSEDQVADPLIAAAEGIAQTPAYRGVAYAVFEDFQLADYGNRIPSLSFEIEADARPIAIGDIAEQLSGGRIVAGESPALIGYAASGDSVRGAIEELAGFVPLSLIDGQDQLLLTTPLQPEILIMAQGEARANGTAKADELVRHAAATIPSSVTLAHYEPARDFQTGLQRAFRGGAALIGEQRALPIAIDASGAKQLVEGRLAALWASRASARLHDSWRRAVLRPGALVRIGGEAGLWKVERSLLEAMIVRLELVRVPGGGPAEVTANPGRATTEKDLRHGPTVLRLVELPLPAEPQSQRPQLLLAAAGGQAGWRRAALMVSFDRGGSWQELGSTAGPAVMGTSETALPPSGSTLLDRHRRCVVALLHEQMWLESRTDAALIGGANLALIGDELVQFGSAEPLGYGRFRLSRLMRGRFGTEWAMGSHEVGEQFLLLDRAAAIMVDAPISAIGSEARVTAAGVDDGPDGVVASLIISGETVRPPSPVHLKASRNTAGDVMLSWVRRSRDGWPWLDGTETPLAEETERYLVSLSGNGFVRQSVTTSPAYIYSAGEQAADEASGTIEIAISQIGTHARSREAVLSVTI